VARFLLPRCESDVLRARRGSAVLAIGLIIAGIILLLEGEQVYMLPDSGPGLFLMLIGFLCFVIAIIFARDDVWYR